MNPLLQFAQSEAVIVTGPLENGLHLFLTDGKKGSWWTSVLSKARKFTPVNAERHIRQLSHGFYHYGAPFIKTAFEAGELNVENVETREYIRSTKDFDTHPFSEDAFNHGVR